MVGEGDILPILTLLKSAGKDVYELNVNQSRFTEQYTGFIAIPTTALREGYTAPTYKIPVKKEYKYVPPKNPTPRPDAAAGYQAAPEAPAQPQKQESKYIADAKKILSGADILAKYKR